MSVKTITVKRLSFQDIFTLGRIMQKCSKDAMKGVAESGGSEMLAGLMTVFSFPAAEEEIYRLLASVTGMKADHVRSMDPDEVIYVLETIVEQEDLEAVFQRLRALGEKTKGKLNFGSTTSSESAMDTPPISSGDTAPQ